MLNVVYDPFLTRKTPFLTLFILSRTSDNTTFQNIGETDAWAVPHLKFWGTVPLFPLGLRPCLTEGVNKEVKRCHYILYTQFCYTLNIINWGCIMRVHLDQILSSSASSIFALRKLRSHGLQASQLHLVARTTTVASLMYAYPAWWGFTSAEKRVWLERLLARRRRGGYLPQDFPTFEELAGTADHQLFKSIITNPHHVLRRYFPEKKPSGYNLRPRVHNCELPVKDIQNFVPRTIYGELKLK